MEYLTVSVVVVVPQRTKAMIETEGGGLFCSWGDFYWEECNAGLTTRVTDMGVCFTVDTRKLVKESPDHSGKKPRGNPVGNAIRGLSLVVTTANEDVPFRLYHSEGFKVAWFSICLSVCMYVCLHVCMYASRKGGGGSLVEATTIIVAAIVVVSCPLSSA